MAAVKRWSRFGVLAALLAALAISGCAPGTADPDRAAGPPTSPGQPTGQAGAPQPSTGPAVPPFVDDVSPVTAGDVSRSWRPGCPVGPEQLRRVRLGYWGFDGQPHVGTIIVHRTVTADVITIFAALYRERFPIRRMEPVDRYDGSDDASMAADNTSGFNCRKVVSTGPSKWSVHAYGQAIDVNPVENPYLVAGRVLPPAGSAYRDRSDERAGMAVPDGVLVEAFASVGWHWGGGWKSPDYQHFSRTGG